MLRLTRRGQVVFFLLAVVVAIESVDLLYGLLCHLLDVPVEDVRP